MKTDIIVEILLDGTISVKTSDIAEQAHVSADEMLSEIEDLLGGETVRQRREHPFMKNKAVLRGGKIVKVGGGA